jgi:hypothetical protein
MNTQPTGVPLEIVAGITAALSVLLDQPVGSFIVTSIQPEAAPAQAAARPASSWAKAGLIETHLGRRQFGVRSR